MLLTIFWLFLSACQTTAPAPQSAVRLPADIEILPVEPAAPPPAPAELMPLQARVGTVEVRSGNSPAQTFPFSFQPTGTGTWELLIEGRESSLFEPQPDGALWLISDTQFDEGVTVHYEPPLVVLPSQLGAGATVEAATQLQVVNVNNAAPRDQGAARYITTLIGPAQLQLPDGTIEAQVVRIARSIQLNLAQVQVVSYQYYAPGRGWVGEDIDQTVQLLGLFPVRTQRQTRVVSEQ